MKQFVMLSGLPRSGSSVLCSMLNQHPDIYASTTSPVIDLIEILNQNWQAISAALVTPVALVISGSSSSTADRVTSSVCVPAPRT